MAWIASITRVGPLHADVVRRAGDGDQRGAGDAGDELGVRFGQETLTRENGGQRWASAGPAQDEIVTNSAASTERVSR
jgi:hypothetical protein